MTDFRLFTDRTMCVAGPSQSGKTTFVTELLQYRNEMFNKEIKRVKWYYGIFQPQLHSALRQKGYEVKQGLPSTEDIKAGDLLVLDDLLRESKSSKDVTEMFIQTAHHREAFIIYITQNIFDGGKEQRTRSLNTHYLAIFKNPRDSSQIHHLSRQILPQQPKVLSKIYEDVTKKPHGYLFIDLTQECPERLRFRTNIIPNSAEPMTVFSVHS